MRAPVRSGSAPAKGSPLLRALIWAAALLGAIYALLWMIGGFLITADPLQKSNAIVVLSGGDEYRLPEAVHLYMDGLATRLILTNTGSTLPEGGRYLTEVRLEAVALGIPQNDILTTERLVSSTRDEALAVRETLAKYDLQSIIVVTDPFHARRTRLIFAEEFEGSGLQVRVYPVQGHWYRSNSWMFSVRGWRITLTESIKLFSHILGIRVD